MLDLTTLELIPRELFVSKVLALPDCMIIGCNTAGAGVLQFYPVRLGIGKNYQACDLEAPRRKYRNQRAGV
jgi:hypothetical protein